MSDRYEIDLHNLCIANSLFDEDNPCPPTMKFGYASLDTEPELNKAVKVSFSNSAGKLFYYAIVTALEPQLELSFLRQVKGAGKCPYCDSTNKLDNSGRLTEHGTNNGTRCEGSGIAPKVSYARSTRE